MTQRCRLTIIIGLLALASVLPSAELRSADAKPEAKAAAAWPNWRGPQQDGYSTDTRVPLDWANDKNLKWKIDLPGLGNSTPIIWGDRIFLTSATKDGGERYVLCVERSSGKVLWKETAAKDAAGERLHEWNTHASASCTTDGERVYAYFGNPGVFCYDFNGKLLWKQSLGKLGCSTGWGIGAASPCLFEDLVIVNGDHGGMGKQKDTPRTGGRTEVDYGPSYLWAFNKKTGEVVWKTERNQGMSWGTPIVITTPKGRTELLLNSPHGVMGYDPKTGKELWRVTGRGGQELFGEVMPVWGNGMIFAFTGRPGPAWAIRMDGSGDVSKTHLAWSVRRGGRDVSSPIVVGDLLYGVDRQGVATCVETKSGNQVWRERLGGEPCASFLHVRGKLLLLNERGTAYVLEPGRDYKLLHTNKLGEGDEFFRASPAIVDGQMLIRSDRRLYCIAEKSAVGSGSE